MPNIGPAEIFVILIVALLVFGPDKLPEIGKQVGRAVREFRKVQATLRDEVREVLEPKETSPAAAQPPQLPPIPEADPERDGDDAPTDQGTPASTAPDAATPNAAIPAAPPAGLPPAQEPPSTDRPD